MCCSWNWMNYVFLFITTVHAVSRRFYAKVSDLHTELYRVPESAMANPLVAFTLIKRLHSEWLNIVFSDEAMENTQGWLSVSLQAHLLVITPTLFCCHHPTPQSSPFGPLLSSPQVRLRGGRRKSSKTGRPPGGRKGADEAAGCVCSSSRKLSKGSFPESQQWQVHWNLPAHSVRSFVWWWLLSGWKGTQTIICLYHFWIEQEEFIPCLGEVSTGFYFKIKAQVL